MVEFVCDTCGSTSVVQSDLGQHICADCGTQSQEMMEEAAEDGMLAKPNTFVRTLDSHVERHETQDAEEAVLTAMEAAAGVAISDDPFMATAIAYVTGMQLVLQGVLENMVAKFGCNKEVMGVAGEIWHSLVQQSEVLCDGLERQAAFGTTFPPWPAAEEDGEGLDDIDLTIGDDDPLENAELDLTPEPEPEPTKPRKRRARKVLKKDKKQKPRTGLGPGQQWNRIFSVLARRLPNDLPLSIAYLACFWLREPIMPTDIVRWTLEGHLPYLAPSRSLPPHIQKRLRGRALNPLSIPSPRLIESRAALIADRLSLELPPINARLVAARLLKDLGLPDSLAASVDRLLDLVTPQGFWLSSAKTAIPPRTFVAAIVVVAVKLLHHLGGPLTSKTRGQQHHLTPPPEVLHDLTPPSQGLQTPSPAPPLITRPGEPVDLPSLDRYLRYLKDVIFKGAEPAADLKEYHAACEKLFQGAVGAARSSPPVAVDADVAGIQRESCEVGVLTPMLDTEAPMAHEMIRYAGNTVSSSGHQDYVRLLRSAAAAIWVTPKGLHKAVKEVELDLFELERNLQDYRSNAEK